MTKVALAVVLLWCAAGCTAQEARHDGDVFLDDVSKTTDALMNPPDQSPW